MGNKESGEKAAKQILERDPEFFKKIGKLGGQKSRGGGFASEVRGIDGLTGRERAAIVGKKGGTISKRR